ncbi:hypothetical protein CRG98_050026, partial [Punica granatum]
MGSTGNPNPWAPYNTYKDCSLGICSIYCPQWCYIVFPPPPPSDSEDGSGSYFSPLVIAVIGILASAFLLVTYYTLVRRYCGRRRQHHQGNHHQVADDANIGMVNEANRQVNGSGASGLNESIIKSITVYKYQKGEGLVDGTDCSVCLSEFEENESLRLMPKCNHAFHLPCIDKWLKSHSSCPLCRSNIASLGALPPAQSSRVAPNQPPSTAVLNVNSHAYCRATDAVPVLVIQDDQRLLVRDETVISLFCDGSVSAASKAPSLGNSDSPGPNESNRIGQEAPRGIMK